MELRPTSPIITLTTDFGLSDHYAGSLKGVILNRCPEAHIVDISHAIAPFSIWAGAYCIDQAAPYFPTDTIHVVVVDPGVGTARRALLVQALGQQFIAPDNGVLSMIFSRDREATVREITNPDLRLPQSSSTFQGRDVFAPVAAMLAAGTVSAEQVGPVLPNIQILDRIAPTTVAPGHWSGAILSIDHFGNVITNFRSSDSAFLGSGKFEIRSAKHVITAFHRTFGEAPSDLCFAYAGSSGYIELGLNQKSAARFLGASPGDQVELHSLEVLGSGD